MNAHQVGEAMTLWVNQGERDALVVAVIGEASLIEYEMPNGSTAMVVDDPTNAPHADCSWRSISLRQVVKSKKWAKAIAEGGVGILPSPQGGGKRTGVHYIVRQMVEAGVLVPGAPGGRYYVAVPGKGQEVMPVLMTGPEPSEPESCGACGGDLIPLGQLGSRMHGRCRNCGIDQSWKA